MAEQDLSPEFPAHIKPVHVGPYLTKFYSNDNPHTGELIYEWYAFWDGARWGVSCPTPEKASENRFFVSTYQNKTWKGIVHA